MADIDRTPLQASPAETDLVSLEESLQAVPDRGPGATSQDSMFNAAEMFQAQLEQMTAWKHQLAQQMEVMRRDGLKLLERQKNLAVEKKRAGEERSALAAEREKIHQLQRELAAEQDRLSRRAAEVDAAQAALTAVVREKEQA